MIFDTFRPFDNNITVCQSVYASGTYMLDVHLQQQHLPFDVKDDINMLDTDF